MRIAINLQLLNPGKIGGMEVYVRNLLDHMLLADRELEYLLFVTKSNSETFQFDTHRVGKCLLETNNAGDEVRQALKNENADLYFCPLLILDPLIVDIPCVITIPDVQHEFYPDFFPPKVLQWRNEHFPPSVRLADAILTLSEFSKRAIVDKLNVSPDKVHAIHLAAEDAYAVELVGATSRKVKKKYGLPDAFGYYPANTWPHKNHTMVVKALASFRGGFGEPPTIILTGSKSEGHEELMRRIGEYRLKEHILYLGYVDKEDMPYLYNNASFLVFPSLFEGFGMPVLEAMHAGCPVICSDKTSLPEVAGEAVLYCDPSNPDDIAEKMDTLMKDDELRKALMKKGKDQAAEFSWEKTAAKTLEVFRNVANLKPIARMNKYPKVSVITPSFNQGLFIKDTIDSVLSQDYPNLEYIVVDGGSTDDTLDILNKCDKRVNWLSEPDLGQADAVNKGFKMARGEILGWLNSDDTYTPGAVRKAVEHLLKDQKLVMLYGDAYYIDHEGNITGKYRTKPFDLQELATQCYICQPAVFLRSEAVEKVGFLDINLHTCMDFDYWIRIGKHSGADSIAYLKDEFLASSRMYSENKTLGMREKVYEEIMDTAKKHFGYVADSWKRGYWSEIVVTRKLSKYGRANSLVNPLLRSFYFAKLFTKTSGAGSFGRYLKDVFPWTKRISHVEPGSAELYQDGWVSECCRIRLKNRDNASKLLIEGRHMWPVRSSLKLKVFINEDKLETLRVKEKGSFSFAVDLPEKHTNEDSITVMIQANKTFSPFKHGINDDTRRLSFLLENIKLI